MLRAVAFLTLAVGGLPAMPQSVNPSSPEDAASLPGFDEEQWEAAIRLGSAVRARAPTAQRGRRGAAIERGLEWLKARQHRDGSWRCPESEIESPALTIVGSTAAGLLPFLGNGSTMRSGAHKDVVRRATIWLRAELREVGAAAGATPLDRALAAYAITECYGVSNYKILKRDARDALFALTPDIAAASADSAALDSAWCSWTASALRRGAQFELDVDPRSTAGLRTLIDRATDPESGRHRLPIDRLGRRDERRVSTFGLAPTAELLLARVAIGGPAVPGVVRAIVEHPPARSPDGTIDDPDYWVSASWIIVDHAHEAWAEWSKCHEAILETQGLDGSWPASGALAAEGGDVYTTALILLALEAPNRCAAPR